LLCLRQHLPRGAERATLAVNLLFIYTALYHKRASAAEIAEFMGYNLVARHLFSDYKDGKEKHVSGPLILRTRCNQNKVDGVLLLSISKPSRTFVYTLNRFSYRNRATAVIILC
jgi:hypothetical protein